MARTVHHVGHGPQAVGTEEAVVGARKGCVLQPQAHHPALVRLAPVDLSTCAGQVSASAVHEKPTGLALQRKHCPSCHDQMGCCLHAKGQHKLMQLGRPGPKGQSECRGKLT